MRIKYALIGLGLTLALIGAIPGKTIYIEPNEPEKEKSPTDVILAVAYASGIPSQKLIDLAICESSLKHEGIYGDGGLAYGLMQFHEPTFDRFKKEAGRPELDYRNMEDQIWLTAWAINNNYASHWTCWPE